MNDIKLLEDFGLEDVGQWKLSGQPSSIPHLKNLPGIEFQLNENIRKEKYIVYAFVIKEKVVYVGETSNGLESRFSGYKSGAGNEKDTDNKIKKRITKSLLENNTPSIWAGTPVATLRLSNPSQVCEVPASKPVEQILINRLKPELNIQKTGTNITEMPCHPMEPSVT